MWETINSLKKDRVIVLTTHNMEEADFLGDNIMVMHGGRGEPCTFKTMNFLPRILIMFCTSFASFFNYNPQCALLAILCS